MYSPKSVESQGLDPDIYNICSTRIPAQDLICISPQHLGYSVQLTKFNSIANATIYLFR